MEIGAYFQCYKQPKATFNSLASFRIAYPNGTVVLVSDNGLNYSNMAKQLNCLYFHETKNTDKNWWITNKQIIFDHFERMCKYVSLIKEDYFMILEDDVFIVRRILEPFAGDLNGNRYNPIEVKFLRLFEKFKDQEKPIPYTGHGGSVWKKESFLKFFGNRNLLEEVLNKWELLCGKVSEDIFMSTICLLSGGTLHHLTTHKDKLTNRVNSLNDVSVLHQCKDLYEKTPFNENAIY